MHVTNFFKILKMYHMRLQKLIIWIMEDNTRQMKEGNTKSHMAKAELVKVVATF